MVRVFLKGKTAVDRLSNGRVKERRGWASRCPLWLPGPAEAPKRAGAGVREAWGACGESLLAG